VAAQSKLGLWTDWRLWVGFTDLDRAAASRKDITAKLSVREQKLWAVRSRQSAGLARDAAKAEHALIVFLARDVDLRSSAFEERLAYASGPLGRVNTNGHDCEILREWKSPKRSTA
jgi:hypothetical protein